MCHNALTSASRPFSGSIRVGDAMPHVSLRSEPQVPYTAEISRETPSCILFLIDQSESMIDPFRGEPGQSKAQRLADAVNRLINNLIIRCSREDGVRHFYDVGMLGYGANSGPGSAFSGELAKESLVPIAVVQANPARVETRAVKTENGAGGLVTATQKFITWVDAIAENGTPMCEGLRLARTVLEPWVQAHPRSFPPIVINVTDGESSDGNPRAPAQALRELTTNDGNVLLFNLHLSSHRAEPILYPEDETPLPNTEARDLFDISSILPPHIRDAAIAEGYELGTNARGFVFNTDIVEVIRFLDIGTRPQKLR